MKLNELTIKVARKQLDNKEISSLALTQDCLLAIKKLDKKLHACLLIDEVGARRAAREADKRIAQGEKGSLLGIPFLVKDNIMTKGLRTTAASKILEDYVAPYDATVITRLKKAGAVLLGKTNLDEFAHGASTKYSAFGVTHNPWDTSRVAGGSSGGSAAAVAAHLCLFALGTDTGGSVRHPASFCGVVGLKPSYGLSSRFGLIAMTSSTDVPGILAKNSTDAATVLEVIAGRDERDATSLETKKISYLPQEATSSLQGLVIGVPKDSNASKEVEASFEHMKQEMKKHGAKFISISLPSIKYAVAAYYIITPSEVSSNLARFDGLRFGKRNTGSKKFNEAYEAVREAGFGGEVKRRIMLGTYCLSAGYYDAYYLRAQKVRTLIIDEFNAAFKKCDLIMTPTTPTSAFKKGAKKTPLSMYLEDQFLIPASFGGMPAISIPGSKKPLPTGIQFIAPFLEEKKLLQVASICEGLAIDRNAHPNV